MGQEPMSAGFARTCINPPLGTPMYGFAARDAKGGAEGIHDDLYMRTLYLVQGSEEALIIGCDLLFFDRAEVDRFKGALGRTLGLAPRQILINTSHTHLGPMVGTAWTYAQFREPHTFYLDQLERAMVETAQAARASAKEATLWAGVTKTKVPMNRRGRTPEGTIRMLPNPGGVVADNLPVCLIKDSAGEPICLLFSVSCHPSTSSGYEISADYPGVAMRLIDAHLGKACSHFLQGTGGDAKAAVIAGEGRWRVGDWNDIEQAGRTAAQEVIALLGTGLTQVEPNLKSHQVDMIWPLQPLMSRDEYAAARDNPRVAHWDREYLKRVVEWLDAGRSLPTEIPVLLHGIQLGNGLRMVGYEGEAVAELGLLVEAFYGGGITFPLGYTDGCQNYLPTSAMLDEGGYEATSCWEYGVPANFAQGIEEVVTAALEELRAHGVR